MEETARKSNYRSRILAVGIILTLLLVHGFAWWNVNSILSTMVVNKAELFLDSLANSAEQTLQASRHLEQEIVSRLVDITARIIAIPAGQRSADLLNRFQEQFDLKAVELYDRDGKYIIGSGEKPPDSFLPHEFGCHEILHGNKKEHSFGFTSNVFCEADAFGYARALPEGGLIRILTGVDYIVQFERNVGIYALFMKLGNRPGIELLQLTDVNGKIILKAGMNADSTQETFTAGRSLMLHGKSVGYFQVTLVDQDVLSLRRTSNLLIFLSSILSLVVVGLLIRRFRQLRKREDDEKHALETQSRIEGLGKVVAAIAHDVRNPLNTLSLGLRALKTDIEELPQAEIDLSGNVSSSWQTRMKLLEETVQHANNLVRDLLTTTRPIQVNRREIRLPPWRESFLLAFKTMFPEVHCNFVIPQEESVFIDPDLLQRMCWNLVVNSGQAGAKTIDLTLQINGDFLEIEVKDNGQGIPEEILRNLFAPGNTHRPDGTGLGLYNVHRIATALGGIPHVRTGPEGTKFLLQLPWQENKKCTEN